MTHASPATPGGYAVTRQLVFNLDAATATGRAAADAAGGSKANHVWMAIGRAAED